MQISGYAALLAGLWFSLNVSGRKDDAVSRLQHREVLPFSSERPQLWKNFELRADRWAHMGGVMVALLIVGAFLEALAEVYGPYMPVLLSGIASLQLSSIVFAVELTLAWIVVPCFAAYIAGRVIGRMIAYGSLGRFMEGSRVSIEIIPGHIDGVGGLKPLGDFFFFLAMRLAIPAIHLSAWSLLIPSWPDGRYDHWQVIYPVLLLVAIGLIIIAFVLPMLYFHRIMKQEKKALLPEADRLSKEIHDLQRELEQAEPAQGRDKVNDLLNAKTQRYNAIEQMHTWPAHFKTIRVLTLNNVALSIPLVAQFILPPSIREPISDLLAGFLNSLAQIG